MQLAPRKLAPDARRPGRRFAAAVRMVGGWGVAWILVLSALAVLLTGIGGIVRAQREAKKSATQALTLLDLTATLEAHLERTLSESRGYAISRDAGDRDRTDSAALQVANDLTALGALQPTNQVLRGDLDRLGAETEACLSAMRHIATVVMPDEPANPELAPAFKYAVARMAVVRDLIAGIKARETSLLAQQDADATVAMRWLTSAMMLCASVIVAIVLVAVAMTVTAVRDRAHAKALRALNARLEARVRERTAELAASEARQRGYFEGSPIGMFVLRPLDDGQFLHEAINPAAAIMYGQSRGSMVGRTVRQIWPEHVADDIEQRARACLSGHQTLFDVVERRLHGANRIIDIILVPLHDERHIATHVLICARDITAQRALEREILAQAERQAEAAERESAVFRNSIDVLYIVKVDDDAIEPTFTYEAISPVIETWIGVPASSLVGRRPEDCYLPSVAATIVSHYKACLSTGETYRYTATYPRRMGVRDVEGSVSPVRHPTTGKIIRLVGATRDVTERNRTEALLRQTQKVEALGRLAAGVAHDFNNMLQSIIGGLELVLDGIPPGTDAHEFAEIAIKTAERGAALTQHLLAYTRMQALAPRSIELSAFLGDLKSLLVRLLGDHIAIDVNVEPGTPPVMADFSQLHMALVNLAMNADQAMGSNGRLLISARRDLINCGDWVCLVVTDSGRGMDEETLARATDPFFTTKGPNGSGLGLSMVKGFIEQSGGELHLSSRVGHGTRVSLHLPLAQMMTDGTGCSGNRAKAAMAKPAQPRLGDSHEPETAPAGPCEPP